MITDIGNVAKLITESNLFRNSGLNIFSMAFVSSPSLLSLPKPIAVAACSDAPAFEVIIRTTFLKSTVLPLWSVSFP